MKAMIFAAGLGTRLKPLTDRMPKALVPVCGKPLLAHVVEKLKSAGYDSIVINVHHFADMIEDYVHGQGDFGIDVRFSDERNALLETGGGIFHARRLLEAGHGENSGVSLHIGQEKAGGKDVYGHFLVHNVDIVSDLDLGWFESQARPEALASLLVSSRETSRYLLFDDDMRLTGWTNVATGEVRSPYLPQGRSSAGSDEVLSCPELGHCRKLAFAGIHDISCSVFPYMEEYIKRTAAIHGSGVPEKFSIMDFYLDICSRHPVYGVMPQSLRMVDVGKFDSLAQAESLCREIIH